MRSLCAGRQYGSLSKAYLWKDFQTIKTFVPTFVKDELLPDIVLSASKDGVCVTLPRREPVKVFTVTGTLIHSSIYPAGKHIIAVPQGIYLAKVNNKTAKIVVR